MTGDGFGADERVTAHWASPSGPVLGHVTTSALGSFMRAGLAFTVPLSPTGIYAVYAVGQTSHATAASLFTVMPFLSIVPTSGVAGSSAQIGATGFGARETVTVKWDCSSRSCAGSTVVAVATTNADGNLSKVGVVIPAGAGVGTHTIGAIGKSSHAFATTRYTVTP
jgi:hypothetical protein